MRVIRSFPKPKGVLSFSAPFRCRCGKSRRLVFANYRMDMPLPGNVLEGSCPDCGQPFRYALGEWKGQLEVRLEMPDVVV